MKQVSILLTLAFLAGMLFIVKQATASAGWLILEELTGGEEMEEEKFNPPEGQLMGWKRKGSVRGRRLFTLCSRNQNRFFRSTDCPSVHEAPHLGGNPF